MCASSLTVFLLLILIFFYGYEVLRRLKKFTNSKNDKSRSPFVCVCECVCVCVCVCVFVCVCVLWSNEREGQKIKVFKVVQRTLGKKSKLR